MQNDIGKRALALHKKLRGKVEMRAKAALKDRRDLSLFYTPGVGAVASHLAKHPEAAHIYTMKGNAIAVISDGSAVLGLGNLGPEGALPVMEGKAMIFKAFANIDAIPLVLDTQETEEIIATVKHIAPLFGGINLEDIAAPRCFEIEERLKRELRIPVMHDDQHGTAIVVLAGLINAFRVVGKRLKSGRIVILGSGAAGVAIAKLLHRYGAGDIVLLDRRGIVGSGRKDLVPYKRDMARLTNPRRLKGGISDALAGADALIGVSGPDLLSAKDVRLMAKDAIVFAMANPIPEIMPEEARRGGAAVIATGRSDFPNQINNSLVFPGVFRGALDRRVRAITEEMKLRAAERLASLIKRPTADKIIPDMLDKRAVRAVASAIR